MSIFRKIICLVLAAFCVAGVASAKKGVQLDLHWAKLLDAPDSCGIYVNEICNCDDGSFILGARYGRDASGSVTYGKTNVCDGYSCSGVHNVNWNSLVIRIDSASNMMWRMYSDRGRALNQIFAPVSDGGVLLAVDMTVAADDTAAIPRLVFADGSTYEPADWAANANKKKVGRRAYILAKTDSNGSFVWGRQIYRSQYFGIEDVCEDNDGNIYLAGWYNDTIVINDPVTGVAQDSVVLHGNKRNSFILKLDPDGNYLGQFAGISGIDNYISRIAYIDDEIYIYGNVSNSVEGATGLVDGRTVSPSANGDIFFANINEDLTVDYFRLFKGYKIAGNCGQLIANINTHDGYIYISGELIGGLGDENSSVPMVRQTSENYEGYEGYIIKLDASTGDWLDQTVTGKGNRWYNSIITYKGVTLAIGSYSGNIFLDVFDEEKTGLERIETVTLMGDGNSGKASQLSGCIIAFITEEKFVAIASNSGDFDGFYGSNVKLEGTGPNEIISFWYTDLITKQARFWICP